MKLRYLAIPLLLSLALLASCTRQADDTATDKGLDPRDPAAWSFLKESNRELIMAGDEAYQSGDHLEAARYYLNAAKLGGGNANLFYNLACCYALLDQPEAAATVLRAAVRAGFEDIDHMNADPDFTNVKDDPDFVKALNDITVFFKNKQKFQGHISFVEMTHMGKYRICFPAGHDPKVAVRLVVGLHGFGDNPDNFMMIWSQTGEPDFIYVAPEAPFAVNVGDGIGMSWSLWGEDEEFNEKSAKMTESFVLAVIADVKKHNAVSDTFLCGFSQGGGLTFSIGLRNPGLFKGIIPMGGWLEDGITDAQLAAAKPLPILIVHGEQDPVVPYEAATGAKARLDAAGYANASLFSFTGGHTVHPDGKAAAREWMDKLSGAVQQKP
jgi:phospholipase/carboxylesterase